MGNKRLPEARLIVDIPPMKAGFDWHSWERDPSKPESPSGPWDGTKQQHDAIDEFAKAHKWSAGVILSASWAADSIMEHYQFGHWKVRDMLRLRLMRAANAHNDAYLLSIKNRV